MIHVDVLTFCQQMTFLDAIRPQAGLESFSDTTYFLEPYWLTDDFSIRKTRILLHLLDKVYSSLSQTILFHGYPAGLNWPIGIKSSN